MQEVLASTLLLRYEKSVQHPTPTVGLAGLWSCPCTQRSIADVEQSLCQCLVLAISPVPPEDLREGPDQHQRVDRLIFAVSDTGSLAHAA